jgi:hypothetical protein
VFSKDGGPRVSTSAALIPEHYPTSCFVLGQRLLLSDVWMIDISGAPLLVGLPPFQPFNNLLGKLRAKSFLVESLKKHATNER